MDYKICNPLSTNLLSSVDADCHDLLCRDHKHQYPNNLNEIMSNKESHIINLDLKYKTYKSFNVEVDFSLYL